MPRNVRNFWLDASIDGKSAPLAGGPRARDEGFRLTVKQRDNGSIITAATITGHADQEGHLTLTIETIAGECLTISTSR